MSSIHLHPKYGVNPTVSQCFFCCKDKNELVLLGRAYKEEAPRHMCLDREPCDECKKYMEMGVILVSVRNNETDRNNPYRTGGFVVVKEEAAKRIFGWSTVQSRFAFVEDEAWDKIGLPRGENHDEG